MCWPNEKANPTKIAAKHLLTVEAADAGASVLLVPPTEGASVVSTVVLVEIFVVVDSVGEGVALSISSTTLPLEPFFLDLSSSTKIPTTAFGASL